MDFAAFIVWPARFLHILGLALAIGGAFAAFLVARSAAQDTTGHVSKTAAMLLSRVEIPGAFVAIIGGILLIVARPEYFSVEKSGVGPWLHIKLTFVMVALAVSHLRMFNMFRLSRALEQGEPTAGLAAKAGWMDPLGVALYLLILVLAVFRYAIFG